MTLTSRRGLAGVALAAAGALTGCRAGPAEDAGFVAEADRMIDAGWLPFHKVWVDPAADLKSYGQLYVAPVDTRFLAEMDWWERLNPRVIDGDYEQDVEELAQYFRDAVVRAFQDDEQHRFEVVEQPRAGALILELALIEVVPSKAVLHALGWLPPIGTGATFALLNPRTVAFEARVRDAGTREVLATFADRERQPAGPLDVTRLTWYGPAQAILDQWAAQFVAVSNRAPDEVVKDPIRFTLRPW